MPSPPTTGPEVVKVPSSLPRPSLMPAKRTPSSNSSTTSTSRLSKRSKSLPRKCTAPTVSSCRLKHKPKWDDTSRRATVVCPSAWPRLLSRFPMILPKRVSRLGSRYPSETSDFRPVPASSTPWSAPCRPCQVSPRDQGFTISILMPRLARLRDCSRLTRLLELYKGLSVFHIGRTHIQHTYLI